MKIVIEFSQHSKSDDHLDSELSEEFYGFTMMFDLWNLWIIRNLFSVIVLVENSSNYYRYI